ncbi:hypothetical protein FRC08_016479 [Ceratobasidium sp. 394]|nr:hypothetical protein FRC08_016479 [Ceratobasidium sp. 394]
MSRISSSTPWSTIRSGARASLLPNAAELTGRQDAVTPVPETEPSEPPPTLPPHKWSRLRHLSLADNALTFFPTAPLANLTYLTHLDLSSNLLVAVPSGLGALYNLVSLNLSDNMIDSVLGIYTTLGSITNLDLSRNRLESLCGLERLGALERVDIRHNHVEESAEVGRLVTLPNITNISIEGNPFTEIEDEYRARCFEYFLKDGKSVTLDGTPPSFYDRRSIAVSAPEPPPIEPAPAPSPNVVAVAAPRPPPAPKSNPSPKIAPTPSPAPALTVAAVSPQPKPVIHHQIKPRKRKPTRIVELDDPAGSGESRTHSRAPSADMLSSSPGQMPSVLSSSPAQAPTIDTTSLHPGRGRHQRHMTHAMPSPIREDTEPVTSPTPPRPSGHRRQTSGSSLGGMGGKGAGSKAARRRARASASVYEPPSGEPQTSNVIDDAEAFRRKMEALRAEVGDSWLKVLSQQQQGGVKS